MTLTLTSIASVPSGPKLCRDCKWVERGWFGPKMFPRCMHEQSVKDAPIIDLVSGRTVGTAHWMCSSQRMFDDDVCGPEAKLWEARR